AVKSLGGGAGACYLYVRRDMTKALEPRLTGWQAHARPFAFETGAIDYTESSMLSFAHGTPQIPAAVGAVASYEVIKSIGIDLIRARSLHLTQYLIDSASERVLSVNSETR